MALFSIVLGDNRIEFLFDLLKFEENKCWNYIFLLTLRGGPSNGRIFCSILPNDDYMAREYVLKTTHNSPHLLKNLAAKL